MLGVTPETLRVWDKTGELVPDRKTNSGTRLYDEDKLFQRKVVERPTIAYARVSSHDQKADLTRQVDMLQTFCTAKGWEFEVIRDLGSGLNFNKRGLQKIVNSIVEKSTPRLVLTHKDRLLRFGSELLFQICEKQGIEVVIINQSEETTFEQELVEDVLEIITVFSAKLYGSRSKKHKEVMETMRNAVSS